MGLLSYKKAFGFNSYVWLCFGLYSVLLSLLDNNFIFCINEHIERRVCECEGVDAELAVGVQQDRPQEAGQHKVVVGGEVDQSDM